MNLHDLKPISFERFLKAVNKLMDIPSNGGDTHADKKDTGTEQFIQFRADRKMQKILLDDILYIESLKDYTKIVTRTKNIVTKQPISSLENSLPKPAFIRIHRSYIVALAKVESYTSDLIEIGRQELPIGRMYRHEVEKLLSS
jgi:DNA-binding LytR/AlgR family response regulator